MLANRVRMGSGRKDRPNPNLMKGTGSLVTDWHVARGDVIKVGTYGGVDNVFRHYGYLRDWAVMDPAETYTNIRPNTIYTFSILIQPTNRSNPPSVHFSSGTGGYVDLVNLGEYEEFFLYARTFNSGSEDGSTWQMHLNTINLGEYYVSTNIKLEEGEIATEWVPHTSEM